MNLAVTVALVPALFTPGASTPDSVEVAAGDTLETVPVRAIAALGGTGVVELGPSEITTAAATTTTTTTAPPPPPTTVVRRKVTPTTAKPVVKAAPAPTTTTTAKPRPTTTTPAPAEDGTETGKASWYDHKPGVCAHKSLPFGTVVTVTHTGNGKSTTCTVGDRGPYIAGWIIDLHPDQFEDLAPRSTGVIPVRISW